MNELGFVQQNKILSEFILMMLFSMKTKMLTSRVLKYNACRNTKHFPLEWSPAPITLKKKTQMNKAQKKILVN